MDAAPGFALAVAVGAAALQTWALAAAELAPA